MSDAIAKAIQALEKAREWVDSAAFFSPKAENDLDNVDAALAALIAAARTAIPALIAMVRERDASLSRLTGELVWYEERNTALVAETEALTARATRAEAEVKKLREALVKLIDQADEFAYSVNSSMLDNALDEARRALEAKHEA